MSESIEYIKAAQSHSKHESRIRKLKNINGSLGMLGENEINYVTKNDGVHVVCSFLGKTADFWPSTGKFNLRGDSRYFRGVRLLIKILRGDYTDEQFKALKPSN